MTQPRRRRGEDIGGDGGGGVEEGEGQEEEEEEARRAHKGESTLGTLWAPMRPCVCVRVWVGGCECGLFVFVRICTCAHVQEYLPGSHTDAVLGLAWNSAHRHVRARAC